MLKLYFLLKPPADLEFIEADFLLFGVSLYEDVDVLLLAAAGLGCRQLLPGDALVVVVVVFDIEVDSLFGVELEFLDVLEDLEEGFEFVLY